MLYHDGHGRRHTLTRASDDSLDNMMKEIEMTFTKDSQIEYMPMSHSISGVNIDLQESSTFPNLGFIFTGFSLPSSNPFSEIGLDTGQPTIIVSR
jgi:hypothetical protein